MKFEIETIYERVWERASADGFAGWDPFDGLESRVFQATPLRHLAPARVGWLQMVKRSPVNLRPLLGVPKGVNSKGIALFALAELSRSRTTEGEKHFSRSRELLDLLRSIALDRGDGIAFGYNFDWQSRAFYAPKGTPTIVPTAFAARAFIESYQANGQERDLDAARRICSFIVSELQLPHETETEVCFSYTPGDASLIYNASLLAGETLAAVGLIDGSNEYLEFAEKAARYVLRNQGDRGEWAYGPKLRHAWVDNFHTAFVLSSLVRIGEAIPALKEESAEAIRRGFGFWIDNFVLIDGAPKYFDSKTFPIDIHSAAAAIVTLADFAEWDERALPLAERVAGWTIENMFDEQGFFYYQKRRSSTIRIPFIRWGQAWMAYAVARLMEARGR